MKKIVVCIILLMSVISFSGTQPMNSINVYDSFAMINTCEEHPGNTNGVQLYILYVTTINLKGKEIHKSAVMYQLDKSTCLRSAVEANRNSK